MSINPKMISIARESRGLTQTELAKKINISLSNISRMEFGSFLDIKDGAIEKIANALNYPVSFFYQDFSIQPPNVHYRKRLTLSPKIIRKADALMNIYRGNIEKMLNTLVLNEANIPILNDNKYAAPKKVAAYLRSYWNMEKGAIKDLITLVEKHGIFVIMFDFETDKIDGRSMMTDDGHPVIFINKFFSGERQRMTLCHELGHIAMHLRTFPTFGRDEEAEAFEFASEFLMPESEIRDSLMGKLTLWRLADLKRVWKVSMGAILYWAEKLECISSNQSRYLWSQYSSMGYKRKEPLPVIIDQPTLINRMIKKYIESQELTNMDAHEEVAKIFSLSKEEFESKYISPKTNLRVA